jgi:hypothetical protein
MGFENSYYYFIKYLYKLAEPLMDIISDKFKCKNWQWSDLYETPFEALK